MVKFETTEYTANEVSEFIMPKKPLQILKGILQGENSELVIQHNDSNAKFIFDKSSDVVMLYSANKYDISDQVVKAITRSSKRKQANTKSEKKELENEEVVPVVDNDLDERQKALEEKKAQRARLIEDRKKLKLQDETHYV